MATQIKVWEIRKNGLVEIKDQDAFRDFHKETELEEWIAQNPSLLGEELLVIARQRPGLSVPDLLCIDSGGRLVIVELKRQLGPREAVAQALDYASWLDAKSPEEISALAKEYLRSELEDAFKARFGDDLDLDVHGHRIFIVAPALDDSAERIINYLVKQYRVDINAVFFAYRRFADGKEALIRSVLVPESTATPIRGGRFTEERLTSMARDRGTLELMEVSREMEKLWDERCESTAGGSFRYWTDNPQGGRSMVFGINVAGGMGAPKGELDVWIRTEKLAEVTGASKEVVEKSLREHFKPFAVGKMDFVVRLKSKEEAEGLVVALRG